jgi:hypothetical protein
MSGKAITSPAELERSVRWARNEIQAIKNRMGYSEAAAEESGGDYEADLGDPAADGYVLSSTMAGVRSWIALSQANTTDLKTTSSPTFVRLTLSQATGTAPLTISSTTVCTNLNADLLDGSHAAAFALVGHNHAGVYEPAIAAGTSAQYRRGDKTWQTLNQAAVSGLTPTDSPTLAGLTLSGLTASLPVVTNGSKGLASLAYATFKTNLSLAQADISGLTTANTPQFAGIKVQQTAAIALNRIYCYSATAAHYPEFSCLKSHSDSAAAVETVNTDVLGMMRFVGVNTTPTANYGAYIQAIQNGAAGTYVPTDLRFYVYDSSLSHVSMTLTKDGGVHVGGISDVADNNLLVDGTITATGGVVGLSPADSPTFVTVKCSGLTDGYIPYHVSDAAGLANSPIWTDGTSVSLGGNVGVGQLTFGTSATKTLALGTGVAPSTSPADAFQLYSADQAAGNACPYFRTENGTVIGLNQSLLTTSNVVFVQGTFTTLTSPAATNLTISPTGDVIFDPTGNDILPNTNYDLNLGALSKKYLTLHAAELWVETLVAQETIATIGGRVLVAPTNVLVADLGSGDTTIHVKYNNLANGDRVYMEAGGKVEFMAVASAAGGGAGDYTYTVTRNLDGSGANDWYAGDAILNTGTTGDGFIDLYSVRGVKSALEYGPTIVGNVRTGTDYNAWDARWAAGNLNGLYGYATDIYGFAAGEAAETWVAIDATNGFRVMHGATVKTQIDASGNATFVGSITAAGGTIGGWVIGTADLKDAAGTVGMSSAVTGGDDIRFWAGHATPADAPFYVTGAGVIKATSGTIGGFTLATNKLSAGTDADYVAMSADGTNAFWAGDSTFADAKFSVTAAGAIKAVSGTIGGWTIGTADISATYAKLASGGGNGYASFGATPPTSYGDNEGVWIGSDTGVGKLSIYKDANNYLKFDGANLALKSPYCTISSTGIQVAVSATSLAGVNSYRFSGVLGMGVYGLVTADPSSFSSISVRACCDSPYSSPTTRPCQVVLAAGVNDGDEDAFVSVECDESGNTEITFDADNFDFANGDVEVTNGKFKAVSVTGLVPEGTIIAWSGGYFTDGSNGGYTRALGTAKTIAAINTLWNSSGWYVCDGAALNLATSTIYNGAGRYLLNLTDARFLMGDTTVGGIGGASSSAHTHSFSDTSTSEGAHTHNVSGTSGAGSSHNHTVDPAGTASGTPSAQTTVSDEAGSKSVPSATHTHNTDIASFNSGNEAAHTHGAGSYGADSNGAHTHDVSGTTGAASVTENRPKYLSVVYLQYVLAA